MVKDIRGKIPRGNTLFGGPSSVVATPLPINKKISNCIWYPQEGHGNTFRRGTVHTDNVTRFGDYVAPASRSEISAASHEILPGFRIPVGGFGWCC